MGHVCVALAGLETIAPKVVSIMLKSEVFSGSKNLHFFKVAYHTWNKFLKSKQNCLIMKKMS